MITKPTPKTEVAISKIVPDNRLICLYATPDAASDFADFGKVDHYGKIGEYYQLYVDSRYDFDEVVNYIKNY